MSPSAPEVPSSVEADPPSRQDATRESRTEENVESGECHEDSDDGNRPDTLTESDNNPSKTTPDGAPALPSEAVPNEPPLPDEAVPSSEPPLPREAPPPTEDDGWDFQWDPTSQAYFFYNRLTGKSQWENPRLPGGSASASAAGAPGTEPAGPRPPTAEAPAAGGYNPAIHGDYDPNAWYAQADNVDANFLGEESAAAAAAGDEVYGSTAQFNRFTGQFQSEDNGPGRHTDDAKSKRQMNAFFDVDAAANSHDGRSLKAERSNKKPSKSELKAFKEKRRARKEEKRRAWLRD